MFIITYLLWSLCVDKQHKALEKLVMNDWYPESPRILRQLASLSFIYNFPIIVVLKSFPVKSSMNSQKQLWSNIHSNEELSLPVKKCKFYHWPSIFHQWQWVAAIAKLYLSAITTSLGEWILKWWSTQGTRIDILPLSTKWHGEFYVVKEVSTLSTLSNFKWEPLITNMRTRPSIVAHWMQNQGLPGRSFRTDPVTLQSCNKVISSCLNKANILLLKFRLVSFSY